MSHPGASQADVASRAPDLASLKAGGYIKQRQNDQFTVRGLRSRCAPKQQDT